jgi:hypothetical protein
MLPFYAFVVFTLMMMMGDSITNSDEEEEAGAYFTEVEKELCKQFCGLITQMQVVAVQLKESLIARGKLSATTTHEEIISNDRFIQLLTDLIRLSYGDNYFYGTIVYDGTVYRIATDFELSNKKMKPNDYKQRCGGKIEVHNLLVKSRATLLRKLDRDVKILVDCMGFIKPERVTPVKVSETKEEVEERINAYMVCMAS